MHRAARRLLTLLLGTALVAAPLTLVAAPAQAAPAPSGGTVVAWGYNSNGLTDVPASLATKKVVAVAASGMFSLALTDDGAVTAWGDNTYGQLDVPAALAAKKVTAIAAGGNHSLAVADDGTVTAWGSNITGQTNVPAALTGKHVIAVAAGYGHSLALTDDGTVTAWGDSAVGMTNVPASLTGKHVTSIAAGQYFSLALADDGTVTAWGDNYYGQSTVPASLTGERVTAISGGGNHALALTDDGIATAWGYNGYGQTSVPASLTGKRVTAIAAGQLHSLAVTDDGLITGWGQNNAGQTAVPASLAGKRAVTVAASVIHSLAIVVDPPTLTTDLTDDTATIAAGESVSFDLVVNGASITTGTWTIDADAGVGSTTDGTEKVTLRSTKAGTHVVTLTVPTTEGPVTGTVTLVVTPDAVATLDVTGPASAQHGDTVSLTATGTDRFGNPTGDETDDVTVASSSPADTISGADVTFGSAGARTLTVTHTPTGVTATRTVTVSLNAFATSPSPAISGVVKVGETLTADAGAVAPTPDSLSYQWLADGREIAGATGATFTPGTKQVGARLSVRVTALRTGYTDATVTSAETAPVAGSAAPSPRIDVAAAKQQLRRGQSTTLTWTSTDADRVTASGAWTGTKPATGRATVKPGLGTSVYRLTATNAAGTASAQVAVTTTRQATRLRVAATDRPVVRGTRTRISVRGLDARETYSVRVAGRTVARGTADARGTATPAVTLPWTAPTAGRAVVVTGSVADRTGRDSLAVVTGKLAATAKKSAARASTAQRITVRGLVPGQKVRVTYRGKTISAATARASKNGTYTVRFDVGQRWGTKKVTVRSGDRTTRTSFTVTPRHG
ncbi:hypothetical protein [Aeromicrobium sp. IC_218]|uniref:RCC1 domain-containing protein n=1 Tax=Aeromicrobium sp. IC_218 TaxID=2545468 RepID=UPI00103E980F|nr:hypothetical protein [Aeromicrobium sp. IC_218]TCI96035.1 hypothetical protein E0W78_15470 [Aeromicrobium sp. IC_218]